MTVRELEETIWRVEQIRVFVRANEHVRVGDYRWGNAAQENWRISELMENRIAPTVDDHDVACIDGTGEIPHGRTLVRNVRRSYA